MKTYDESQFNSLDGLNDEIAIQEMLIRSHTADCWYTLEDAKEGLRKTKEAKRVFIYRAHQSITPSGKTIRR